MFVSIAQKLLFAVMGIQCTKATIEEKSPKIVVFEETYCRKFDINLS